MKFDSIQLFRAIAANAVVLSHLHGIEGKYGRGFVVLPEWAGQLGPAGVHFFFVISGCVMVFASQGVSWTDFFLSRVTRIYPVYWFYTSIFVLAILLVPQLVSLSLPSLGSLLKSYLLWPDSQAPVLTVGWSLIFEMYFYVVLTLASALAIPLRVALPLWVGVILTAWFFHPLQTPLGTVISSPLALEFVAGMGVGLVVRDGPASYRRTALCVGVAGLVAGFVRYVLYAPPNDTSLMTVVTLGIPFSLILYAGLSFEMSRRWPGARWIVSLGDASYSTYLSHSLVLTAMGRIFSHSPFSGWIVETAFVILYVAVANLAGIVSYLALERPSLVLSRAILRAPARNRAATS